MFATKKGEVLKDQEIFDLIDKNNLKYNEVVELNLIELNSFLSLLNKEFEKIVPQSERLGNLVLCDFKVNHYVKYLALIFADLIAASTMQAGLVLAAAVGKSIVGYSALMASIVATSVLFIITMTSALVSCYAGYLILGSIYIVATQEKRTTEQFKNVKLSSCSKDILKAFKKIKESDFLIDKDNKPDLDTVGKIENFVKNKIFLLENHKLVEKKFRLTNKENKEPVKNVSKK